MKVATLKVASTLAALTLGLAATGLAHAEQLYYPMDNTVTTSTLTRAQVVEQLREAQAHGLVAAGGNALHYPPIAAESTKSRAQVLSELRLAQAHGEIQAGESSDYPVLSAAQTHPTLMARYVR